MRDALEWAATCVFEHCDTAHASVRRTMSSMHQQDCFTLNPPYGQRIPGTRMMRLTGIVHRVGCASTSAPWNAAVITGEPQLGS